MVVVDARDGSVIDLLELAKSLGTYYTYDEEYESYMCDVNMDEDEYMRLISDQHYQCPYYRNGDDYRIVRHQM